MRYLRGGLIAAVAFAALAGQASAVVSQTDTGHRISYMARGAKAGAKGGGGTPGAVLFNHNGPVLPSEAPYLIFWTPGGHTINSASEGLLESYLGDVAHDSVAHSTNNVYSVLGQYGSPYSQVFSPATQAYADADPYPTPQGGCNVAAGMTACVTDASIQAEIAHLIDTGQVANPAWPVGASPPADAPIFLVVTPVDVNVCTSGGSCVNNSFCAYHDFFTHNNQNVVYASVPFSVFADGVTKGCQTDQYSIYESPAGSSGDEAYNVADDLSHELSESITDPLINAWYSNNGLEIGDLCEAYSRTASPQKGLSPLAYAPAFGNAKQGTLWDQVINGDEYYNQTEYSNQAGKCQTGLTPLS